MSQVSRPMQIALLATVLVAVVWFVALRPKPPGSAAGAAAPAQQAPSAPGVEGLKRAVDKAHGAVDTASADAQRAAASNAEATSSGSDAPAAAPSRPSASATTTTGTTTRHGQKTKTHAAAHHGTATDPRVREVRAALRQHKAIAIAFVDRKISDARAVAVEIAHVSRFGGRAVTLSVPLPQLSRYGFITRGVDITVAPTTLIIARNHEATTIVGFTDRLEIQQRLADALR